MGKKTSFGQLINSDIPVLVDFSAAWCGPCKAMVPVLKEVSAEFKDEAKVVKIDIDKNPKLAQQLSIRSVPTLVLYKNGKILWRQAGMQPSYVLSNAIRDAINN